MAIRYGPAELYGQNLESLEPAQIRKLANAKHKSLACPFKAPRKDGEPTKCPKKGGVCSLRAYTQDSSAKVSVVGAPVTTCPNRFLEDDSVIKWVGKTLLSTETPRVISELPFLVGETGEEEDDQKPVGKIDKVLVHEEGAGFQWCALEMQAVYFSGMKMENDFQVLRQWRGPGLPLPPVVRRPDFRSSGPKRLMPQLQIKVPTISRWGRKMAVIVDLPFWESLGEIREVNDLSNCDIAWFVMQYALLPTGHYSLRPKAVHFTTLTHAVEGLTGGAPVSLKEFEASIRAKLGKKKSKTDPSQ